MGSRELSTPRALIEWRVRECWGQTQIVGTYYDWAADLQFRNVKVIRLDSVRFPEEYLFMTMDHLAEEIALAVGRPVAHG